MAIQTLLDSSLAQSLGSADELAGAYEAMHLLVVQGLDWPAWILSPEFPTTCDSASFCNYGDWSESVYIGRVLSFCIISEHADGERRGPVSI